MENSKSIPREAVLIINAHSRRGQALFDEAKMRLEDAGIQLIAAHAVRDPKKITSMVDKAVADGAPMVIVGGGDGSLSCTVDFVAHHDCVFALLPLGTANSFARTLGIPLDLEGAVQTIISGKRRRIDLGMINGDYFANCAAMGLSPFIGEGIPRALKKYLGRVGYFIWALWCLFKFRPFALNIDDGENSHSMPALEVRICNGRFHGGVEIIDDTDVDNGVIVVQIVTGKVKSRLIWNWLAIYFRLPARHETTQDFRGKRLYITTKPPLPISIDGEVLASTPAVCEIARCALEVVVPEDA